MAPVRRNVTSLPADPVAAPSTAPTRKRSSRPSEAVAAERKAYARKRHAEKASRAQIAAELGMSAQTVKTWMLDKVAFPPHPVEPTAPDPRLVTAAALWADGKTIGDVAVAIGVPKTTLAGWMRADRVRFPERDRSAGARAVAARRRAGVTLQPAAIADRPAEVDERPVPVDAAPAKRLFAAEKVDAAPDAASAQFNEAAPAEARDSRPARAEAFRPLRGVEPIPFDATTGRTCKWPVHPAGERDTAVALHSCGCPTTAATRPYCAAHAEIGFNAPVQRRQKQPFHLDRGRNGAGVQRSGAAWAH